MAIADIGFFRILRILTPLAMKFVYETTVVNGPFSNSYRAVNVKWALARTFRDGRVDGETVFN